MAETSIIIKLLQGEIIKPLKSGFIKNKCPRGDSNSYTFRRYPLKIVCLPISPLGLVNTQK